MTQIKKLYRKAALKYHPDKLKKDETRDEMIDVYLNLQNSFDTLKTRKNKENYDYFNIKVTEHNKY